MNTLLACRKGDFFGGVLWRLYNSLSKDGELKSSPSSYVASSFAGALYGRRIEYDGVPKRGTSYMKKCRLLDRSIVHFNGSEPIRLY